MNTILTINRPVTTVRRPTQSFFITLFLAFTHSLFATRIEPSALRYMANKYNGEID